MEYKLFLQRTYTRRRRNRRVDPKRPSIPSLFLWQYGHNPFKAILEKSFLYYPSPPSSPHCSDTDATADELCPTPSTNAQPSCHIEDPGHDRREQVLTGDRLPPAQCVMAADATIKCTDKQIALKPSKLNTQPPRVEDSGNFRCRVSSNVGAFNLTVRRSDAIFCFKGCRKIQWGFVKFPINIYLSSAGIFLKLGIHWYSYRYYSCRKNIRHFIIVDPIVKQWKWVK